MADSDRSHAEWYAEAARWYVERHQGCCWCGRVNQVYRTERGGRVEYECGDCAFYVCHEQETDQYFLSAGNHKRCTPARPTMHAG